MNAIDTTTTQPEPLPPGHVRLARVPATLSARDAAHLRWYFASGGHGRFRASTMGALLDRAALFAHGTDPCEDCGGDRETGRAGTGFVVSAARRAAALDDAEAMLLALMGSAGADMPRAMADQVCPRCRGIGFLVRAFRAHSRGPLTARMTGSSKHSGSGGGVEIDHEDLARLGLVSRRLDRAESLQRGVGEVLEAWALGPETDRVFAVLPLTPAGRKLCRGKPDGLDVVGYLRNELELARGDTGRKMLFTKAREQAEELLAATFEIWNEARAR